MLEFLSQYGVEISAIITGVSGLLASIFGLVKVFKNGKQIDKNNEVTKQEIQVTREGIVEAFKEAKIPNEWKISVSNQVNSILTNFRDELITTIKENEKLRNKLMILTVKILSFTAASNKLTEDEKAQLNDLIKEISEEDSTIDITK